MRNPFVIAAIFAVTTALSSTAAFAQSGGGGGMSAAGSASGSASAQADATDIGWNSLARADAAAGKHALKGRNVARANKTGFCPPGQAKKPGLGSRHQC